MDSGDESDATTTDAPAASESTPAKPKPISASHSQKGSPAAPSFTSIGSPQVATHSELQRGASAKATNDNKPQEQLRKTPEGDQASAAVQVEGLMDTSEGPLKM
jgi:protein phosphatase 2C family protein 2/3